MSALPKSIQQGLDTAEQLQRMVVGEPVDQPTDTTAANEPEQSPQPEPVVEQTESATPAPAPEPSAPRTEDEPWEQRYRTLQGKYASEITALHEQLREMQRTLTNREAPQAPAAQPPKERKSLVTQQDVDAFGSDLIDLIGRKAAEIAEAHADKLRNEFGRLEQALATTVQRQELSETDRFNMKLASIVPNYREINQDQRWHQWLGVRDPLTGATRQMYLDAAAKVLDADRVAAIFKAFSDTLAPAPAPQVNQAQQELRQQVAPARTKASSPPVPNPASTKIWTQKDINKYYEDLRRGFLSKAEADRIESELNAAAAEGRIRA